MIIQLTTAYLASLGEGEISDLYVGITQNGHYLDCDDTSRAILQNAVEKFGSRTQKHLVKSNHQGHLSAELRQYLTTIPCIHFSYSALMVIVCKPSCLMIENLAYESDVYRSIIGTYVGDPRFRNIFKKLDDAQNRGWLTFLHSGGFGMMGPLLDYYERREYAHVTKKKIAVLMDRDTDTGTQFPSRRTGLLEKLSGKAIGSLTNADVYTLSQNAYIWHIWQKRAIENYFPPNHYDNLGFPSATAPSTPIDWSFKDLGKIRHYSKSDLFSVSVGMSRFDYETICSHFFIGGINLSEMQLFLLKLVKLI